MIPLPGSTFPSTAAELADVLRVALRPVIRLPDEHSAADKLRMDLTGGALAMHGPPEVTAASDQPQPGPSFSLLEVLGHPLKADGAMLHLDLTATDVRFNYDRTPANQPVLTLAAATDGRFAVCISRADLEALVTAKAREAASAKGIDVQRIELTLTQLGPRSVRLDAKAHVQTKALFKMIGGAVTLSGQVDIDDELVIRLSHLDIAGEGMMVALAVNMVRSRVTALEGAEFPLTTLAAGDVRLRDVQMTVGNELSVTAAFGG
jgi:hypothetical protein